MQKKTAITLLIVVGILIAYDHATGQFLPQP